MPAGYVKAFWLCFQYNAARATALRDHKHLMLERAVPCFPDLWPDTEAGATAIHEQVIFYYCVRDVLQAYFYLIEKTNDVCQTLYPYGP